MSRAPTNSSVSQRPSGRDRTALVKLDRNLLVTDATPKQRRKIRPPRIARAERQFMTQLREVGHHVGQLVNGFEAGNARVLPAIRQVLRAYAQALTPWAVSTVQRMLGEVDARDRDSWRSLGSAISSQLRNDLLRTPVGGVLRGLMHEQVDLITSLPTEAAERVHHLTIAGLEDSTRANEIAGEIARTGEVTESRAMLIARTEVARTASVLTETRALGAGVTYYRWQTSKDGDVRPGHRAMQGKICRWDSPPAVEENGKVMYHHPGRIWNCFTADTLVTPSEGLAVIRAGYRGDLITINAAGTEFEATPNHPILTPRGWVAAGMLQVGEHVCAMLEDAAHSVMDNVEHGKIGFGKVFEASILGSEAARAVVDHLYGDPVEQEIDIVPIAKHLARHRRADLLHHVCDKVISGAYRRILGRWVMRGSAQILEPLLAGLCDLLFSGFGASEFHLELVRDAAIAVYSRPLDDCIYGVFVDPSLGRNSGTTQPLLVKINDALYRQLVEISAVPELVARFQKPAIQRLARHIDPQGDSVQRQPRLYKLLRVSKKTSRNVDFAHVYTLETSVGYYGVGKASIIAQNCRCWAEPLVEMEDE